MSFWEIVGLLLTAFLAYKIVQSMGWPLVAMAPVTIGIVLLWFLIVFVLKMVWLLLPFLVFLGLLLVISKKYWTDAGRHS